MKDKNLKLKKSFGIIANDAGAANLILGWIKKNPSYKFLFYLEGPAKKIFLNFDSNLEFINFDQIISNSDILITGTSFFSNLEHNARKLAKKNKILTIAVIDHWVNYQRRFVRDKIEILPDIIWVFDEFAEAKAKQLFKGIEVVKKTNHFLNSSVKKINKITNPTKNNNILYVLEPIRKDTKKNKFPYEFEVLDYFIKNLKKLNFDHFTKIRLRPHPSDLDGKYNNWLAENNQYNISLSKGKSLEEDIAWANTVVGYETYALVIASASSRRCITSIPPNNPNCRLMIKNLEYLRDIRQ